MTTVAELAARAHVDVGYLIVLQGCPFAFTDRAELAGTGVSSWIGTGYGPRRVIEGLDLRGATITYATELGDGRPDTDDGLTFKVIDFDSELIAFFAEQEGIAVGERLGPKDDPAPANVVGINGDNVPIFGKWVNSEAIGPAGERSYYSLLPAGDGFGQDHAAISGTQQTLAPSYVYDTPTHLEGRRVALYRIFRDTETGVWANWEDQHDSGASLIWVGSLTNDAEVEDITWTIKADGPSSWLRKQLGQNRATEWTIVSNRITLNTTPGAREDLIALSFIYQQASNGVIEFGGSSYFDAGADVLTATTASDFRFQINARINTVSAAAGPDITWDTTRNGYAQIQPGYVETRIDDRPAGEFNKAALWALGAHEKVWRAMGYDPYAQAATHFDTDYEIKFLTGEASGIPNLPGPGYWVGHFWTVPVGYSSVAAADFLADNDGKTRVAQAIAPEDISQMPPLGGFEVSFGVGSPGYIEGQTNRAPVSHEFPAGGMTDAQGYVAFRGSYLSGPDADAEVETMVQLANISWRKDITDGGDAIALDDIYALVYLSRYIDGRFHGVDRKPLDRIWASHDLEWAPVNFLGYAHYSGDYTHRILLRLLLSTGTASWSGYDDDGATLTVGANHPGDLNGFEPFSDAEIADLGLGIPHQLIDVLSFGKAAGSLPGGITSNLNRCRYAWVGAQDSQELIASMLDPRGWGLGFNAGRWRLFSRPDLLVSDDVEVVIGPADIMGEPDFIETANLRPFSPREKWKVDFSKALIPEGATEDKDLTFEVRALDSASRSRRDNGVATVEGFGLIPIPLWRGELGAPADWKEAFAEQFSKVMARWCNAAHVMVTGLPVLPSVARQIGPGSVVRFSSYYAPTREGTYGPTAKLGRVYKVETDLESRSARIDVLLQPGDPLVARYFGPAAVVLDDVATVEERHDAASRTFYCQADAFNHGEALLHDVARFIEPAWLGVGGDALVEGWQWDGRELSQTFGFTVDTVSTSGDSITYKVGTLTGTWYESRYTLLVLAPWDDQPSDSWVRSLFSVITASDFTFGSGPTPGYPLK